MSHFKGVILAVGGVDGTGSHKKAEVYKGSVEGWTIVDDYPLQNSIRQAAVVYIEPADTFFLIGGWDDSAFDSVSNIVEYNYVSGNWTDLSSLGLKLNTPRFNHGAIFVNETMFVAGGDGTVLSEQCSPNDLTGSLECHEISPSLASYRGPPILFPVESNYCP